MMRAFFVDLAHCCDINSIIDEKVESLQVCQYTLEKNKKKTVVV